MSHLEPRSRMLPPTMTPKPAAARDISHDWQLRFASLTVVTNMDSVISTVHNPDFVENYDEMKAYSQRGHTKMTDVGIRTFLPNLYKMDDSSTYMVVWRREKIKYEELLVWCCCLRCMVSVWNPIRYIWCPLCCQCIESGSPSNWQIKTAKMMQGYGVHWAKFFVRCLELIAVWLLARKIWS